MPLHILLIDDDREFTKILSERMEIRDIGVTAAASAREAFELVEQHPYDAIILDLQMPDIDGLEALRQLKAMDPGLRILLLSGHATVAKGVEAMKLGAVDVLEKPVDIRVLIDKIHTVQARKPSRWQRLLRALRPGKN